MTPVADLLDALAAADKGRKRALIRQLGELQDPAAVPVLAALVRDRAEPVQTRRLAAQALGQIGDSRGCIALMAVLDEPAQPDRSLIPRLEKLDDQLGALLRQPDLTEAQRAALTQQRHEVQSTLAYAGDMIRLLKLSAVQALGAIGFVLALKPLEAIVKAGHDAELTAAAEAALAQIRAKSGLKTTPEPDPKSDISRPEVLVCARCATTSETGTVARCHNCRLPVCEAHSVREVGLVFCSPSCLDSFSSRPGNWHYWT